MVMPRPHFVEKLTGRVRGRIGYFGRVILQVEVQVFVFQFMEGIPKEGRFKWRDATYADISEACVFGSRIESEENIKPPPRNP